MTEFQHFDVEDFVCNDSFQSYCRGEKPSDILWWENWLREHPEKRPVVADAMRLYELLSARQGNRSKQLEILRDGLARQADLRGWVDAKAAKTEPETETPAPVRHYKMIYRYAAAALVLILAGGLYLAREGKKPAPYLLTYDYYTAANEHKTVLLPDSSVILLNGNSHLSINKDFDASHRGVAITGGAYLNIRHDPNHPFTVSAPKYKIRVLGTVFYINAYPDDSVQETGLISGKVEISDYKAGNSIVLKPSQKFTLTPQQAPGKVASPDSSLAVAPAWTRKKIEIHDESFGDIGQKLEAWYGLKIVFADDTVKNYRYTATFDGETVINVLQSLQLSYPFDYKIAENSIVISAR